MNWTGAPGPEPIPFRALMKYTRWIYKPTPLQYVNFMSWNHYPCDEEALPRPRIKPLNENQLHGQVAIDSATRTTDGRWHPTYTFIGDT